jgi:ribonuclease-3 family protein
MEKGLNYRIREVFSIEEQDIRTYSPLTLAYIGDGIFDLVIRSIVVDRGNTSANQLHRKTSRIVNAHSQAVMAEALLDHLTEKEADIYRRGRNAKSHTMAKNATVSDYRSATGFEALMGYLYLTGQMERLLTLVENALELEDFAGIL